MCAMLRDHSSYRNNLIQSPKKGNPSKPNCSQARSQVQACISGTSGARALLFRGRDWNSRNDRMLYFMVFRDNVLVCRFCSREPSDMGRTRTRDPLSSMSVLAARCGARPYWPGRYFIPALKLRVPGRERRGNFVPKFITRSCCGPRGWTSLPGARTLLTFLAPGLRALLRCPAHTRTCIRRCLLV